MRSLELPALLLSVTLLTAASVGAADSGNHIVLRVNDRIATLYDFESRLQGALERIEGLSDDPVTRQGEVRQVARDVMKTLFDELLVMSRADQLGIIVTDGEIQDALQQMWERNGISSEEEFRDAVANSGVTVEEVRGNIEQQLAYRQVIGREVYSTIDIQEEDLRRYWRDHPDEFTDPERRRLEEIVVLENEEQSASASRSVAESVMQRLRSGDSLVDIAAALESEGKSSSVIDVGWVTRGDLDATLESAVWDLEADAYSEPIEARGGLHIVHVIERREEELRSFKDVEEQLRRQQENRAINEQIGVYLADLQEEAYLVTDVPEIAADFLEDGRDIESSEFEVLDTREEAAAPVED